MKRETSMFQDGIIWYWNSNAELNRDSECH